MPTKEKLLNGIELACAHLFRSTGPRLLPDPITGLIEEDWNSVVVGQSVGDAPIVCVVPPNGVQVGSDSRATTDPEGVTYTRVLLPDLGGPYKFLQPNNDYYCEIVDSSLATDRTTSPKTTTGWVRFKFIDKEAIVDIPLGSIEGLPPTTIQTTLARDVMELEARKITKWDSPLSAPEFEYQVKVNSYGAHYPNARAVFLPNRLIENTDWTTIWKSGSSQSRFGPDNPQRAAAVPGLSPFTMLMSRVGACVSSQPGLASRAQGIRQFYAENNVTFELFDGLGANFHVFDGDPHFIHSEAMFLPGEKSQTERPSFDWWWWPTRTGTPLTRRLYTSLHFPWKEGARSIEALFYLFRFADTIPSLTTSNEDGVRHCYEWVKDSEFDGSGLSTWFLEGTLGDQDEWGQHLPYIQTSPTVPVVSTAVPIQNRSDHPDAIIGDLIGHAIYWGDHLLRFAIACGWLLPALRRQGESTKAIEVKNWLEQSVDILLQLQLPWNGIFVDDEELEYCQADIAGGLFSAYRMIGGVPRSCRYPNLLEDFATLAGTALPGAQRQQGLVPSPHASHYELSIGVILAFALAYEALD